MPLCKNSKESNNEAVEENVEILAAKGLRTLVFAMKTVDWDGKREPHSLDAGEFECDLTLLGATGVEDLLQENVGQCIKDFREAGMCVWMLTGDKGSTAKEIGVSCGLVTPKVFEHEAPTQKIVE